MKIEQARFEGSVLRVRGAGAPALEVNNAGFDAGVFINDSRLESVDGPVLVAAGSVDFAGSEIAGAVSGTAPVIHQSDPGSTLQFVASAIFGNVSGGGFPVVDSAGPLILETVTVAGNTAADGADLIRVAVPDGGAPQSLSLRKVSLGPNFLRGAVALPSPSLWERPVDEGGPLQMCLPFGSDQLDYGSRAMPTTLGPESAAAFISVVGQQSLTGSSARVEVYKSFFTETLLGDGAAIMRSSGTFSTLEWLLHHNLFAAFGEFPMPPAAVDLVDGGGTALGGTWSSVRNVLRGTPSITIPAGLDTAEVTLDAIEGSDVAWLGAVAHLGGVVGPSHPGLSSWASPNEIDPFGQMAQCDRVARACPDLPDPCAATPDVQNSFCGNAGALSHIPLSATVAELAAPWPWLGSAYPATPEGDALGSAGPWGGACAVAVLATDFLPNGDGDGFTNVTDCENSAPSITPSLPLCNGFDDPECTSNACYACPYGDIAGCPLGDDDDSAVTDDDDSAVTDDDDLTDDDDSAVTDDDDAVADPDDDNDGWPASLDCDDGDPLVHPTATEACDAVDSDCNGSLVDTFVDTDGDADPDCTDPDDDNDGFNDGFDCNQTDATVFPTATEACDAVDSDCDGSLVDTFLDTDGDADPDCTDLDIDGDGTANDLDCDALNPALNPGALELCDGLDTDCDGTLPLDERDPDDDGFLACDGPSGGDCDDNDDRINPDAAEACDGVDNDCDPATALPGEVDGDGDGVFVCGGDCDDSDADVFPGQVEICNGRNDDCESATNEVEDGDGDGLSLCDGDCDDSNAMVHPGADEICDGTDNDCDPTTDEAADADTDGFSLCDGDCDDGASVRYPGAPEECNGRDDDCAGDSLDDEADADEDGWRLCHDDCDDTDPTRHPTAQETCDDIDQDCDGDLLEHFEDRDGDGIPACLDDHDVVIEIGVEGCTAPEGCGFGWDPSALALLLPWFGWRRRRATRSRARPRSALR